MTERQHFTPEQQRKSLEDDAAHSNVFQLAPPKGTEGSITVERHYLLAGLYLENSRSSRNNVNPTVSTEALDTFVRSLGPSHTISMEYNFNEEGTFDLHIRYVANGSNSHQAENAANDLVASFGSMLATSSLSIELSDSVKDRFADSNGCWRFEIVPPGLQLHANAENETHRSRSRLLPRLCVRGTELSEQLMLIAQPRTLSFASLDALLFALSQAKCTSRLIVRMSPRFFYAEELRYLDTLQVKSANLSSFVRTDGLPVVAASELAEPVRSLLRRFRYEGKAIEFSVRLEAFTPLPDAILNFAAVTFWGADQFSREQEISNRDWRCLRPLSWQMPQWFPTPSTLKALGVPIRLASPRTKAVEGALLGISPEGQEVRLAESARQRHVYIVGATGSGKSTLIAQLLIQDMNG